jgi:hypothetical protein
MVSSSTPYDDWIDALSRGEATPEQQHQAATRLAYLATREQALIQTLKTIETFLKSIQHEVPKASTSAP